MNMKSHLKPDMLALAGVLSFLTAFAQDDTVVASSFGWNPTNATACLQAAFDSGAKKIIVDRQSSEWLVKTVCVRSDTEIVFGDGVVVRAMPGAMKKVTDCLVSIAGVTNVVLRGEGRAQLVMNRKDYLDRSKYRHGEWRHCVSVVNSANVTIRDLALRESGGDGVYLRGSTRVLMENLVCSGNLRQGVSVISADVVVMRNCVFELTRGALPECGMDIEPGLPSFNVGHILMENCQFRSNDCSGVAINVSQLGAKNVPMNVIYRNCEMFDNAQRGVWFILGSGTHAPVTGKIVFEGCRIWGNRGGPVQVSNLGSNAVHLAFRDCTFDCAGARRLSPAAFQLINGGIKEGLNNLLVENCRLVNLPSGANPVSFGAMTGVGVLPGGAKGVLEVVRADGTKTSFDFSELERKHTPRPELLQFETGTVDAAKLVPANPDGVAISQKSGNYRGPVTFYQHVRAPGEYPIVFDCRRIGKANGVSVEVEVFDFNGTPHDTFTVDRENFTYFLKSRSTKGTIYKFVMRPRGTRVSFTSALAGQGIVANGRVHWLTANNQSIYFQAKPGAEDIKIELTMSPHEWISAELMRPSGEIVAKCVKADAGVILSAKRPKDAPSEIWQLHITRFVDDCNVRLGSGTGGVYAYDPALLLIEK